MHGTCTGDAPHQPVDGPGGPLRDVPRGGREHLAPLLRVPGVVAATKGDKILEPWSRKKRLALLL